MSKSAELDSSRINLLDSPAAIVKKVKGAKTDTFEGLEWNNPERPEARNLLTIYQLATGMSMVRPESCIDSFWRCAQMACLTLVILQNTNTVL